MLHKILTAVTALAVVASLLAGAAGQAAAVSGYDSAYFGESAFLTLGPGQSGQFAVGFNNTGSTGWLTGSTSQVDLAICLPDKVTCNTISPNAAFASNWLSSTDYATTSTTYVGPGQTGYFVYNVAVPTTATPGTYRFNGDLALHGTASTIHPQGYYQDVQVPNVGAPSKLACSATPSSLEAGSTQTSTVTVTVEDSLGNPVTTDSGRTITLSQAGTTSTIGSGAAGAPATGTTSGGSASFTLNATAAGTTGTDQLSASATNLTGCQVNVAFTAAGAPAKIGVTLGQSAFPAGAAGSTTATATLQDASGVTTTATASTTVTWSVDNASVCSVSPTSGTIATGGSTTTTTLTITGVPGTCNVTAAATGLTSGTATATVTASGPAAKLAFTANTCSSVAINTACYVTVQVQDAAGNPVFANNAITLTGYKTGTTTVCSETVSTTVPAGGTGNPATASTGTGSTVKFNLADAAAQTCDLTATSGALTSATTTGTFTGFGAAATLSSSSGFVPNPIPANGASSSSITYCVRDAAGNIVTTNTGDSISLLKDSGTFTTVISANPTTTSSGCATFTVQSTLTAGTDVYHAIDTTLNLTSPTYSINTQ